MSKKSIILVAVFIFLAIFGWFIWQYLYPSYQMWRIGEGNKKFEQGFMAMLKNDTYGGKTPEETYNLYVEALKRSDTEAASRYFYWERQVAQKTKLDELITKGELDKYIVDLPKWSEMREEEYDVEGTKQYSWLEVSTTTAIIKLPLGGGKYQEEELNPGFYKQIIDFEFNKQANIWKIYSL